MRPHFSFALAVVAAAALAGCGGGGSDPVAPATSKPVETTPQKTNTVPVANAGAAQTIAAGSKVTLDGSASSDADGDALSYVWTLTTKPAKSSATLMGMSSAAPTFVADVSGTYVATLVVNDGKADSAAATITVTVPDLWTDFSDNDASVTVVKDGANDVIELRTGNSPLAAQASHNTGITGNRADLAMTFLDGVKLSEFRGISFKAKDDAVGPNTGAGMPYVTYSISKNCDGTGWANLITNVSDMVGTSDGDGYVTYSATIDSASWKASSWDNAILDTNSQPVLPPNKSATANSLTALIQAYPNACIYNWPNDSAVPKYSTKTPAVQVMLGNSKNVTAKQTWLKDLTVNGQPVF